MTMTAAQADPIREAAQATYRELFAPAAAEYARILRDQGIVGPALQRARLLALDAEPAIAVRPEAASAA